MKKPRCQTKRSGNGVFTFLSFPKNYFCKLRVILKKSLFEGFKSLSTS